MLIAYDLRYAADHFTGIGTHAFALLDALLEIPGDERYAVLWNPALRHRRYDPSRFRNHPRVEWHEHVWSPLRPLGLVQTGAWLGRVRPAIYLSPFYLMPFRAGCPCALTLHDVWPLRLPAGLSAWRMLAMKWAFARMRRARLVLTSSAFSRGEIVELLGLAPERVRAVRLGVPPRRVGVEARRPLSLAEGPFALVVGDNRPRKNLEVLARAWAKLGDDVPLRLVGAGPADARYPSLDAMAASAGARRVTALGWVDEPELDWLYANASALLFPSRYEGFGFPLVEAFARGVPALAADIPTLREIGEGVARFLPTDDPGAWAAAVASLATSRAEADGMREASRARAAELTYRRTAEETLAALRGAAGLDSVRAGR